MKEKHSNRLHRISLTLMVSLGVFAILAITILVVGIIFFILERTGVIHEWNFPNRPYLYFVFFAGVSLIVGCLLTFFAGRIPLQPVNRIINALDDLAAGDYSARLQFKTKAPVVQEMTDSFNKMATELENTEMLRSDFINNFSHEFKTPIVSIAGFAKLLRRGNLSPEEQQEYLEIIETESMRLATMATNVLNMTRVENQEILTGVTEYNLSEQLRSCVLMLEDKWASRNLDLDLNFDEYQIRANEELMKQVWLNLLDNALKFTPEGGTVKLTIGREGKRLRVTVENTGSEISPENINRIFRKFYQEDSSHTTEGNGIGLAVVSRIVKLHGGAVMVDSKDMYTVFTVSIPQ